jgi:hypothetical protein
MKINKDIVYHLKNIPVNLFEDISKIENKIISTDSIDRILSIEKNIVNIKNELDDYSDLIKLMSLLDSKTLSGFILGIERLDDEFIDEFLKILDQLRKSKESYAIDLTERLISFHKISTIKSIFDENRLAALKVTLNKYK